jgi:hypothetical protein
MINLSYVALDTEEAEQLRAEAELLFAAIGSIAEQYEEVRRRNPSSRERTYMMTKLMEQARRMAKLNFVNSRAVEELFSSGHRMAIELWRLVLCGKRLSVQILASSPKLFGNRILILNSIKHSVWPKI